MMPDDGNRYELVDGELFRMPLFGCQHGLVAMNISAPLANYVRANNLGRCAAETGFVLGRVPDTVRAPTVAFISRERYEAVGGTVGYWEGAPDLAVEVLSFSDEIEWVQAKVMSWLSGGARMVWVVNPALKTVTIHKSMTNVTVLKKSDMINGADVVPGFTLSVSEIFEDGLRVN